MGRELWPNRLDVRCMSGIHPREDTGSQEKRRSGLLEQLDTAKQCKIIRIFCIAKRMLESSHVSGIVSGHQFRV